ncbi:hypothetical protein QTP88_004902 [Uroleucon formosanum]
MQSDTNEQPAIRTIYSQVIGSPGIFDQETNVKIYFARLKNFLAANGITQENKKRAILLTSISEEVHKTLFSLCLPENPDNKTFESLSDILLKHYEPKKSYFAARHRLYLARKNHDKSVPQWGAREWVPERFRTGYWKRTCQQHQPLWQNDGSGNHQRGQHQRKQGVVKGNVRGVPFHQAGRVSNTDDTKADK